MVIIFIAALATGYTQYQHRLLIDWQRTAVHNLAAEPGLIVINSDRLENGTLLIHGLRDPLSKAPALVAIKNLPHEIELDFDFRPYISLDPDIIALRANTLLTPPSGVSLVVKDSTLIVIGEAEMQWVDGLQRHWSSIYGIERLDDSALVSIDSVLVEMTSAKKFIESKIFEFELSASEPFSEGINLEILAAKMIRLYELSQLDSHNHKHKIEVQIIGSTDVSGTKTANLKIATQRAENIYIKLLLLNVPVELIHFYAMQEFPEFDDSAQQRQVVFRVVGMLKE